LSSTASWLSSDFDACYSLYDEKESMRDTAIENAYVNYPKTNLPESASEDYLEQASIDLRVLNAEYAARCSEYPESRMSELRKSLKEADDVPLLDRLVVDVTELVVTAIAFFR